MGRLCHLITGLLLKSEPAQEKWFSRTILEKIFMAYLVSYIYEAHFECHDILMLGISPIK